MDKGFEHQYHESEKRNWWFVSRRHAVLKILKACDKKAKILDVGCGGGSLMKELVLSDFQNIYGIDYSTEALTICRQRNISNVYQMDGQNPEFDEETFDVIIASDVIEHFENDVGALKSFNRILKKNGILIVFAPAYDFLWSDFDKINHHYRRYSRTGLRKKLHDANFHIDKATFWNFSLFFPAFLMRLFLPIFNKKSKNLKEELLLKDYGLFINQFLISLLKLENIVFGRFGLPIGMSVFALARKPA